MVGKNLVIVYGQPQSGKTSLIRQLLQSRNIVDDRKGKPRAVVTYKGKTVFEIGGSGKREIEYLPIDNAEDSNAEYVVEIPLKKNSSATNQLKNSIQIQQIINRCQ